MRKEDPRFRYAAGVGFMLISGLGFAAMNLFVRLAGDLPATQKSFFRNLIAFSVALIVLARREDKKTPLLRSKKDLLWLSVRSLLGTAGVVANFYAVDHMPVANASVLNKLSPFFTILFAVLFLKEKIRPFQIAGTLAAFAGVVILSKPEDGALNWAHALPVLVAVGGGLAAGGAYTCVRHLGTQGVNSSFIVCFFAGFSTLALLPPFILNHHPMTGKQLLCLLMVGLSALVGQYGITFAYRFASPGQISIFDFSMVVFTMFLSMIVLGQYPDANALTGASIIFGALLLMFLYNRKRTPAVLLRK